LRQERRRRPSLSEHAGLCGGTVVGVVLLLLLLLRQRVALDAPLVKFCILNGNAHQRGACCCKVGWPWL